MNKYEEIMFNSKYKLKLNLTTTQTFNTINKIQIMYQKIINYFNIKNTANNNVLCLNGDFGTGKSSFIDDVIKYNNYQNSVKRKNKIIDEIEIKIINLTKYRMYQDQEKYVKILSDILYDWKLPVEKHELNNYQKYLDIIWKIILFIYPSLSKFVNYHTKISITVNYNNTNKNTLSKKIDELILYINILSKNKKYVVVFDELDRLSQKEVNNFLLLLSNIFKELKYYYFILSCNRDLLDETLSTSKTEKYTDKIFDDEIHIKYLYSLNYQKLNMDPKENFYIIRYLNLENKPRKIKKIRDQIINTNIYQFQTNQRCYNILYRLIFIIIFIKNTDKKIYDFIFQNFTLYKKYIFSIDKIIKENMYTNKHVKKWYKNAECFDWKNSTLIYNIKNSKHENIDPMKGYVQIPIWIILFFSKEFNNYLNYIITQKKYSEIINNIELLYDSSSKKYRILLKMKFSETNEPAWLLSLFNIDLFNTYELDNIDFNILNQLIQQTI